MTATRFEFAFESRYRPVLLATWGARPGNSDVVCDDDGITARFGRFRVSAPWSNVKGVQVTRDYRWYRAIGVRGSLVDRGLTFGSTTAGGVCVCFHEPVSARPGILPAVHPGLTMTVADLDGLEAAVRARVPA